LDFQRKKIFPNLLDITANIAYGISTTYKIISFPIRKGLELITSKTCKSICKAEDIENSELD